MMQCFHCFFATRHFMPTIIYLRYRSSFPIKTWLSSFHMKTQNFGCTRTLQVDFQSLCCLIYLESNNFIYKFLILLYLLIATLNTKVSINITWLYKLVLNIAKTCRKLHTFMNHMHGKIISQNLVIPCFSWTMKQVIDIFISH